MDLLHRRRFLLGIALATTGFVLVALADGLAKIVQQQIPVIQFVLLRQSFQLLVMGGLWLVFFRRQHKFVIPKPGSLQLKRALLMISIIPLYMGSLDYLQLGISISLLNTAPFFALPMSVFLLGERVSVLQMVALLIGFLGVVLIVQPGSASFHPAMLMVLLAAAFLALYMVISRKLAHDMHPINFLCVQSVLSIVIFGCFLPFAHAAIPWDLWPVILASATLSTSFHLLFLFSVRLLEAQVITSLMYAEVASGLIFGLLLFNDIPNLYAFLGIALIVIAGLIITLRRMFKSPDAFRS